MNNFYTFTMLGNHGRLGNQMFQVAAVACLAKKRNSDLVLPNNEKTTIRKHFDIPCQDLNEKHLKRINCKWVEPNFGYQESFQNTLPNADVVGYFQSWKYLTNEDYVRSIFKFESNVLEESRRKLGSTSRIALHIRRGDYLNHPEVHPTLEKDYYVKALEVIKQKDKKTVPIIFTDDKSWCQTSFPEIEISNGSEIEDLCMMSMCDHHVMANSSFSWWGAWLGAKENQIAIAPSKWFGQKGPIDWSGLYVNNWIVL